MDTKGFTYRLRTELFFRRRGRRLFGRGGEKDNDNYNEKEGETGHLMGAMARGVVTFCLGGRGRLVLC